MSTEMVDHPAMLPHPLVEVLMTFELSQAELKVVFSALVDAATQGTTPKQRSAGHIFTTH